MRLNSPGLRRQQRNSCLRRKRMLHPPTTGKSYRQTTSPRRPHQRLSFLVVTVHICESKPLPFLMSLEYLHRHSPGSLSDHLGVERDHEQCQSAFHLGYKITTTTVRQAHNQTYQTRSNKHMHHGGTYRRTHESLTDVWVLLFAATNDRSCGSSPTSKHVDRLCRIFVRLADIVVS